MIQWCHPANGFQETVLKTNISKNTHFRKSETGRYTNCCFKELKYKTLEHMLQGKQSKNCLHYTAKQDSIKTEIQVSGQLNDTERCFILSFQALYCCQSFTGLMWKDGINKEVCLSAPRRRDCYGRGIEAALGDQNHLQDRAVQEEEHMHGRGGRQQRADSV